MGRQCNQGYPCKFATQGMRKNIYEFVNPKTWRFAQIEDILHMHQEVQGGMETRSIDKSSAWQFASP
jgi:hypothetical protein